MRQCPRPKLWPSAYLLLWLLALLAFLPGGLACNSSLDGTGPAPPLPAGSGGSPTMNVVSIDLGETPLEVAPREERVISVRVRPAGPYRVTFLLLGPDASGTAPDDAALDRGEVVTDARGRASITLTAPSAPTTFSLRAQVGGAAATLSVVVSSEASVKLLLKPSYSGRRRITSYTATAHLGASCESIGTDTPTDSGLLVRAAVGAPLELVDVPAVDKLAVVVRAAAFARGCTTVPSPLPRAQTVVDVKLSDEQVDLDATVLETVLALDARDTAFDAELDATLDTVRDAFRNDSPNDVSALLDELHDSFTNSRRLAFEQAREAGAWDETLLPLLNRDADRRLSNALQRWSEQARPAFRARLLEGRLEAGSDDAVPAFLVSRVGGVPSEDIDFQTAPESWSADTSDTLALAVTLSWSPASLLTALMQAPARAETGAADVPRALEQVFDCERFSAALIGTAGDATVAFTQLCDAGCVVSRCSAALDAMWSRASAASGKDQTRLSVLASGPASVGEQAQVVGLTGTWVGRLLRGEDSAQTGGAISGSAPR